MPGSFPGLRGRHSGVEVVPGAVRQARLDAGLSLAQVATPEYTRAALSLVELGKMRPSPRLLRQIARRTGRPISYFLPDAEVKPELRVAIDHLHQLVARAEFAGAIEQGEQQLQGDLPRSAEAEIRFLVGRAHVRCLDGRSAYTHLVRARELYELGTDRVQQADVVLQMASALYLLDDPRPLSTAYQALDLCERLQPIQPELTVRSLMMIGATYFRLQDWNRAMTCYLRALDAMGSSIGIRDLAMLHDQLSQTYQRVGRFAQAVEHAQQALRLYGSGVDPTDLFRAHHNLGETLLRQGELSAARPHLEKALALCDERGLQHQARGYALLSLAELHIEGDELDEAEQQLNQVRQLVEGLGERGHLATAWRLHGRLYMRLGEHERADEAFARAVELLRDLQLPADLLDAQTEYAAALAAQSRFAEASEVSQAALASGQVAVRRVQAGWADLVEAHWGR
jgi:tetratricopeptide (TPR) repeat protein